MNGGVGSQRCQEWLRLSEVVIAHDGTGLMRLGRLRAERCMEGGEREVVEVSE
jgi:hypothetical protein